MLPDCLLPYKHYEEDVIEGVLDEVITPDDQDSDGFPSEITMRRWHHWMAMNESNVNGHLKSVAFRELDFSEELLRSGALLLKSIRSSISCGWLQLVIRLIYNSGGKLPAFY